MSVHVLSRVLQTFDGLKYGDNGNDTAPVLSMMQSKILGNSGISGKNRQGKVG
jgi:hypothetical protein